MSAVELKTGDKVRLLVEDWVGRANVGDILTVTTVYRDRSFHAETSSGEEIPIIPEDVELVSDSPRVIEFSEIRKGDHVRFTRTYSETDRVVKEFVVFDLTAGSWVDSSEDTAQTVYADYASESVIELLNRDESSEPLKVGGHVRNDAPVGTTAKSLYGLFALRTPDGWATTNDTTVSHLQENSWIITSLPERNA